MSRQTPSLPVVRLDDGERFADLDVTRALSLTFSHPLPARDVLLLLFRGTPFSVVFDQGVTGLFTGELTNLTLRQALEAVLYPSSLDYEVKGPVVRVFPRRPQTRLFEVSHLDVRRSWGRQVRSVSPGDRTGSAADFAVHADSDFFQELGDGVRALLSPSGRAHVDRNAGVVQVTDFGERLDQVGLYIETVALRASRQIRLQARVIEITLTGTAAIDWAAVAARAGLRVGSDAGLRVHDFGALVDALGTFGAVRILGSPQMLAMNNEPAIMRVASEGAAFTSGRPSVDFASARVARSAGRLSRGLTLSIIPQISSDGIVHMSVSPTLIEPSSAPGHRDRASILEADTTMRVQDGETVVISMVLPEASVSAGGFGGAARPDRPAPAAGSAELIILLTPTVVKPSSRSAAGAQ